jgi:hypothetical protein
MRLWCWSIVLLLGAAVAFGSRLSFQEHAAVQESLSRVHPRMRAGWLKERGVDDPYYTTVRKPESTGLKVIGRWSFGPSYDVDGRVTPSETLVALARGSGVSLLRFSRQDSLSIELLSDINAEGLMCRVKVADTLLYVGSRRGLEVYNIADEQNPVRLSWTPIPLNDFALQDSLVYTISGDDSFRIYNVSNPADPVFLGACRDSGDLVSVADNAAFLGDRWGLYVIDVSNPASPHRIGAWGSAIEQVLARGSLCYVTTFNPNVPGEITFHILNVSTPASPYQIGSLDSAGGNDVCLVDTLAFGAGESDFNKLTIISVADSTRPRLVGSAVTRGWSMGIWASGLAQATFVGCHWEGLHVYDTRNTSQPVRDTGLLGADMAVDVEVDGGRAYVAGYKSGLHILDVSVPSLPTSLGSYDSGGTVRSATAKDSFAYVSWPWPRMITVDVTDPHHPLRAAGCDGMFAYPEDMVIRDSFVYCAEMNRFQIINVARPREPVLVGSCVTGTYAGDLEVPETLAYISGSPLKIINVARPDSPQVVGNWSRGVSGFDVVDTILYAVGQDAQFWSLSVADPTSPRPLDSVTLPSYDGEDIVVIGSTAYASENVIRILDVSDPGNLRIIGQADLPNWTPRLVYAAPYLYACCAEGGVCMLETAPPGVEEMDGARRSSDLTALPSVTSGTLVLEASWPRSAGKLTVFDVAGKEVLRLTMPAKQGEASGRWPVDLSRLSAGVYVLKLDGNGVSEAGKVIITRR